MKIVVANSKEQKAIKRILNGIGRGLGSMPFSMSDIINPESPLEKFFLDSIFGIKIEVDDKEQCINKEELSDYNDDEEEE
jgi:hypothetical protein